MRKLKYNWEHGFSDYQEYYDVQVGDDYLLVFANKWNPDTWMGQYNNIVIHNKTENDKQRKRQGLPKGCHPSELKCDCMLCSNDPAYMMRKVEWCYAHGLTEISS